MADLTEEQQALWAELALAAKPREGQTEEQARAFAVLSFQQACQFDGIEVPSDEAVLAALDRRAQPDAADEWYEGVENLDAESPETGVESLEDEREGAPDHGEFEAGAGQASTIDLPFESGSADPQPLEYADLGPDKKYVPGGFRQAQSRATKGEENG